MKAEKMKRKKVLKNAKLWNMCDKIGTRGIVCAHAAYKNKHVNVARSARIRLCWRSPRQKDNFRPLRSIVIFPLKRYASNWNS